MCIRDRDIIVRSISPNLNPLVIVIKKDGMARLCLDPWKINQIIIPDRESPKPIEIFKKHRGVNYITSLDLTPWYWQVPLCQESRRYTAFLFNGKKYQFWILISGLNTWISSSVCVRSYSQMG